jgi:hypothetical protein
MNYDHSNKPEGATHVVADIHGLSERKATANSLAFYRKQVDGIWFGFEFGRWHEINHPEVHRYQKLPEQWSGEGLPPVGTVCEIKGCMSHYLKWNKVTVFAVRGKMVFFDMEDGRWGQTDSHEIRSIRTPEQIAAEEREKAIDAMKKVFDSCSNELSATSNLYLETLFGAIHDDGYRKQVTP